MGHSEEVAEAHQDRRRAAAKPERRRAGAHRLPVATLPQPDETTCGPTCLHAVFRYWGDEEPLESVIARTFRLEHGGTFAVYLACDALRRGYQATLYTYNITVFDPSWFGGDVDIAEKLRHQAQAKRDPRLRHATAGYLEFLQLGGRLRFVDLSLPLLHSLLSQRLPVITGLSATYLYGTPRERPDDGAADDIAGAPSGHFVVLAGYNVNRASLLVVDPYQSTPYGRSNAYWISADRVLGAVLLGIVTHDANLLVVHPGHVSPPEARPAPVLHYEAS